METEKTPEQTLESGWELFDEFFYLETKERETFNYFLRSAGTKKVSLHNLDGQKLTIRVDSDKGVVLFHTNLSVTKKEDRKGIVEVLEEHPQKMPKHERQRLANTMMKYFRL